MAWRGQMRPSYHNWDHHIPHTPNHHMLSLWPLGNLFNPAIDHKGTEWNVITHLHFPQEYGRLACLLRLPEAWWYAWRKWFTSAQINRSSSLCPHPWALSERCVLVLWQHCLLNHRRRGMLLVLLHALHHTYVHLQSVTKAFLHTHSGCDSEKIVTGIQWCNRIE